MSNRIKLALRRDRFAGRSSEVAKSDGLSWMRTLYWTPPFSGPLLLCWQGVREWQMVAEVCQRLLGALNVSIMVTDKESWKDTALVKKTQTSQRLSVEYQLQHLW